MRIVLAILCAATLAGCATTAPISGKRYPPTELTAECVAPSVDVTTNAGLASGVLDYDAVLKLCNLDKKALREWAND